MNLDESVSIGVKVLNASEQGIEYQFLPQTLKCMKQNDFITMFKSIGKSVDKNAKFIIVFRSRVDPGCEYTFDITLNQIDKMKVDVVALLKAGIIRVKELMDEKQTEDKQIDSTKEGMTTKLKEIMNRNTESDDTKCEKLNDLFFRTTDAITRWASNPLAGKTLKEIVKPYVEEFENLQLLAKFDCEPDDVKRIVYFRNLQGLHD